MATFVRRVRLLPEHQNLSVISDGARAFLGKMEPAVPGNIDSVSLARNRGRS